VQSAPKQDDNEYVFLGFLSPGWGGVDACFLGALHCSHGFNGLASRALLSAVLFLCVPALWGGFMQHSRALLFFCLFSCAPAFSQGSGIIDCGSGSMTSVPAWIAPGRPQVVKQLSCGQMVSVIGKGSFYAELQYSSRPSEYVKIQIADKVAYVDAQYVKLLENQEQVKVNKDDNVPSVSKSSKEEEEQEKWNVIPKDAVKLRNEKLLNPMYEGGPSTFAAILSNNSEFPISDLRL
jgi:hypothetical protein